MSPEKHPLYAEEWKKFWCRRFKEVKAEGKDPNKFDYRPEWIKFWTIRMKELHDEDIDKKKREIRKSLGLPDEDGDKKTPVILNESPVSISDSDSEKMSKHSSHRAKKRSRERSSRRTKSKSRSRSGSSGDSNHDRRHRKRYYSRDSRERRERENYRRMPDYREYKKYMETSYDKISYDEWNARYGYRPTPPMPVPGYTYDQSEMDDGPVTFVTVCRLLTALEDDLGEKLGNRVTDLLAKSLSLEKVKANSSDEILLTKENCEFFEIIKERLKGRLIANIVPAHKLQAVRKAIRNIATLVHQAAELEEEKPKSKVEEQQEVVTSSTEPAVDKAALAIEITKALIAQGKTDTTKEELQEIINVYVQMRQKQENPEAKKQEEKPKELEKPIAREKSPEKETIVIPRRTSTDLTKSTDSSPLICPEKSPILAEPEAIPDEKIFPRKSVENDMNSLTDDDLKTLLKNFMDLSPEEQKYLISFLREIETKDPERVEKLKKYVNIGDGSPKKSPQPSTSYYSKNSPKRRGDTHDFDMAFNAGPSGQKKAPRKSNFLLSDTNSMVANLMGSLQDSVQQHTIPTTNYEQMNFQYEQMMQQINFDQSQQQQAYMNMYQQPGGYGNQYSYDMSGQNGANPMNPYGPY